MFLYKFCKVHAIQEAEGMINTSSKIALDEPITGIFYALTVVEKILTFTAHDDIFQKIILGSIHEN